MTPGRGISFMALHSLFFVFAFLPLALTVYWLAPQRLKNPVLLGISLLFYAWGDAAGLPLLLASIAFNYAAGLGIANAVGRKRQQLLLAAGIAANVAMLAYCKYLGFFFQTLATLHLPLPATDVTGWSLPLGISFFTFSAVAYLVDVYRGTTAAEKNIIAFGAYLAMFQKIIAGPIARYADLACSLTARVVTAEGVAGGAQRFIIGLGKKVLIADTLGKVADGAFCLPGVALDMPTAWLGIASYTLQIYCDFSGYTDMALGLGLMFGLRLPENFNYPYTAQSVRDFWKRWHMTLSYWFRDYLYIPLGGSRCSRVRGYANLTLVFLLCGLWHGASLSFVNWGLYHGLFLLFERMGLERVIRKAWRPLRHLYVLLVIMVGWVFFKTAFIGHALDYLRAMTSFSMGEFDRFCMTFVSRQFLAAFAAACLCSAPVWRYVSYLKNRCALPGGGLSQQLAYAGFLVVGMAFVIMLFIASTMQIVSQTYSPFIYAQF